MKVYRDFLQGSDSWWEARRGRPTCSSFDRILTPATAKPSGAQDGFIDELVAECIQFNPKFFTERGILRTKRADSPEMAHGREQEDEARQAFANHTGLSVETVGFCESDCGRWGGSPDLLVVGGGQGGELKCPQPATHVGYLRSGELPREYKCQVHGHLILSGYPVWSFFSWCPPLPPLHVEVRPDEFTQKLRDELERFLTKLDEAKKKLLGKDRVR